MSKCAVQQTFRHPSIISSTLRCHRCESLFQSALFLAGCGAYHERTAPATSLNPQVSLSCIHEPVACHSYVDSKNRFTPPPREPLIDAFSGITELQISETMMTWDEMQTITASMPQILAVEFGYNSLTKLVSSFQADLSQSKVQSINLDSNMLGDWIHICTSIRPYPV